MIAKEVIVIGGGFAGINVALQLSGEPAYRVTLVDRNNYNFFPPLLYQVATGFLEASNIAYPFRKLFQGRKNIRFRMGEFQKVVLSENRACLSTGDLSYDYLVFATGTETNFFGIENVRKEAIAMKTVDNALEMRNHYLQTMEKATLADNETAKRKLLNIVVAGGGPTGVEVSGMLAEMKKDTLQKDYPELAAAGLQTNIYLVDAGEHLLSPMSSKSQQETYEALHRLGVMIKLNTHVKDYVNDQVVFDNGEIIDTKTLIWAAGVTARVFEGIPGGSYGKGKRMLVDEYNKVIQTDNVYAIGDTCYQTSDPSFPNGHPQLAQVAIQQGKNLAKNLIALAGKKQGQPFRYHDKGSLAIIGRNQAVADLMNPSMHFKGFIAWFIWVFIHLVSLINYRNRIKTLYNWMIAYFTKDQSLRMIIRPEKNQS